MSAEPDNSEIWASYADRALMFLLALHRAGRSDASEHANVDVEPSTTGQVATHRAMLDDARTALIASRHEPASRIGAIASNARLTEPECELLAVAIALEIDVSRQQVLAHIQDDSSSTRLTMQTVSRLLGGLAAVPAAIGPRARVRRAALLAVAGAGGPWAKQTVTVPEAVVWAMLGDSSPDPALPPETAQFDGVEPTGAELVVVSGPDRVRRREVALSATRGDAFLVVPAPPEDAGWAAIVREASLTGRGVVVELDGELPAAARHWIEMADHLPWAISTRTELPIASLPRRPLIELEAQPTAVTDEEWVAAFGSDTPRTHRLSAQQVEQVSRIHEAQGRDIDRSVRRLLAGPLDDQAFRIRPRHSWDDLVLGPAEVDQLREIVARYRYSGQVYDRWGFSAVASRGLVSLFSGPSGTGKTLAAEVVASELGLDMFKLDLSATVSKYIGETEKNLDKIFDAAGMGNVVLFFDEADSMFGKRSEVKDAHDRYANLEVSYLLQRIESFDGIVVLATNYEKSIDDAFLRRIHARIAFKPPEEDERLAIWRRHLPAAAPLDGVDLAWLARQFELTGGQIRNAAVHAAFLAAAADEPISMLGLVRGVAQELRKAGRLLRSDDFGEWYPAIAT